MGKRWVPMKPGEYVEDTRRFSAVSIDIDTDGKSLLIGDEEGVRTLVPPDNVRLCRLVDEPEEVINGVFGDEEVRDSKS